MLDSNQVLNSVSTLHLVQNMLMDRRLAGPGCAARILETAATRLRSTRERSLSTLRLRGTECQSGHHRFDRTFVLTMYLVWRREMMICSISSERPLMRSRLA